MKTMNKISYFLKRKKIDEYERRLLSAKIDLKKCQAEYNYLLSIKNDVYQFFRKYELDLEVIKRQVFRKI